MIYELFHSVINISITKSISKIKITGGEQEMEFHFIHWVGYYIKLDSKDKSLYSIDMILSGSWCNIII